jgi:nucleotide-binding universal stress UspA family protein
MIELSRILCPVDFSEFSEHALKYAAAMAAWYDARLHVLHVMPTLPPSATSPLAETGRQLTERNLRQFVDRVRTANLEIDAEIVESADPVASILACADAIDADLIVTGSHGRSGVKRALLGSVVESLLHRARRPIMAVPSHIDPVNLNHAIKLREVVCAVDFSVPSLAALAYALSLAEESDSQLTLLHVLETPPELAHPPAPPDYAINVDAVRAEAEADALNRLRKLVPEHARDYCTIETAVLEGGVSRQVLLLAANRHADLIVLGVHGRNALDLAVFGSNSKDVIRHAVCPVLIIPAGKQRPALTKPARGATAVPTA